MRNFLQHINERNGVAKLLLRLLGFFLLLFVVDFCIGGLFSHFYKKQQSGWEYRTKYSVEDTRAEILIFGASRAQQQYNPAFFEERFKTTSYNVGRDGEPIFYYFGVLQGVLARYTPKMIVLDVENGVFREATSSYDRLSVLLPFYNDHPEMREVIALRSPYEKYKLQSRIYPYNSLLFKIAMGNLGFNKNKNQDIKGYVPLTRSLDEPKRDVDLGKPYPLDSVKVRMYRAFIDECLSRNIKLYLVCSPFYFNAIGQDTSMTLAKEIAAKRSVDFLDFSREPQFLNNSKLFDDTVHVNMQGSEIFTNQLIDSLLARGAAKH